MSYDTDQKIKSYLDSNQLHREQMCRAILAIDKRYSDVRPRHPRGGPDGGRDIEALYRSEYIAFGAVGFVNQANDSKEQKTIIFEKFKSDLSSATAADTKLQAFVFFTNISLTIGDKDKLIGIAKKSGVFHCEIIDRERIRIYLDSPDGFSIRFQYLAIPLSEAEQASFFAKWGDDIQSVISTGFQRLENTLGRILFFQEASSTLSHLTLSVELDRKYSADEIGHFRLFCSLYLKEPKNNIISLLFGESDKPERIMNSSIELSKQRPGIKHGISGGQWEQIIDLESDDGEQEKYTQVGSSSSIGLEQIEFLSIQYIKDGLIRNPNGITLRDIDEAMFVPFCNKSLAEKIVAIHIYSNGYKIKELGQKDIHCDLADFKPTMPVVFSEEELKDHWVRIQPSGGYSFFNIQFFDETPTRMRAPKQTENSLKNRKNH